MDLLHTRAWSKSAYPGRQSRFRRDDGAVDPILILGAIAVLLVLTVGGFFAVTGWVNNAKDMNAQADLDRIATVEETLYTSKGEYVGTGKELISDPQLLSGTSEWFAGENPSLALTRVPLTNGPGGAPYALRLGPANDTVRSGAAIVVNPGDVIRISADVSPSTAPATYKFQAGLRNGAQLDWWIYSKEAGSAETNSIPTSASGWTHIEWDVTVPAGVTRVYPWLRSGSSNPPWMVTNIHFVNTSEQASTPDPVHLRNTGVGVNLAPSQGVTYSVSAGEDGYLAAAKSETGKFFVRSSGASTIGSGDSIAAALSDLRAKGVTTPTDVVDPKF